MKLTLPSEKGELREAFKDAEIGFAFQALISSVLNKLEWFSMAFTNRLADEDVVYQSLHQSFIEIVGMLYYRIAYDNKDAHDKFYVNISELFRSWQKRQANDKVRYHKLEEKRRRKIQKLQNAHLSKVPATKPQI